MTDSRPQAGRREIRSYILRQGRYTVAQKNALDQHWSHYGIEYTPEPLDFSKVFGRNSAVTLEIGFGNGESLLQQVARFPDRDFIGIEVHGPGVGHLIHRLAEQQLDNIRLIRHDAVEVLRHQVADNSLAGVQLFFPDPWHKKRHHKRRLVQPAFAELVWRKLQPGGLLHMATDWQNYAEQMLEVLDNAPGFTNLAGRGHFSTQRGTRSETKFERRGLKLGHGVRDIMHIKSCRDAVSL
ncbi:MAG TPA: tRNA (guanosine(46)-N7)-methyltransferase TrmB [Thiotrichales bacterium]|nr:tRNA (guanosine(46)-N7)-methyltransferase TrmB [Thiotrichales bacterium]